MYLKTTDNKRLYASWAFSNGPSALEFQLGFSNLALTNRVYSGQASISNTDYPTSVKPRTLYATLKRHPIHLQATEYLIQSLSWATAHCSTFARYTKPRHKANLAKELQLPTHGNQSLVRQITAGF